MKVQELPIFLLLKSLLSHWIWKDKNLTFHMVYDQKPGNIHKLTLNKREVSYAEL